VQKLHYLVTWKKVQFKIFDKSHKETDYLLKARLQEIFISLNEKSVKFLKLFTWSRRDALEVYILQPFISKFYIVYL